MSARDAAATAPGQAAYADVPAAFSRWCRTDDVSVPDFAILTMWRSTTAAKRAFWAEDHHAAAAAALPAPAFTRAELETAMAAAIQDLIDEDEDCGCTSLTECARCQAAAAKAEADEAQSTSGVTHVGRSWDGHDLEDECPCPKAPCGLVVQETAAAECDEHPLSARRTIRQSHPAGQCPAGQPAPAAAGGDRLRNGITRLLADISRRPEVGDPAARAVHEIAAELRQLLEER